MDRKDGGPAFARGTPHQGGDPGMSLRDWFAGQALIGIIANSGWEPIDDDNEQGYSTAAEIAYAVADSMLSLREGQSDD